MAEAIGVSIEEAAEIHQRADTDGDGSVSIEEILSSTQDLEGNEVKEVQVELEEEDSN